MSSQRFEAAIDVGRRTRTAAGKVRHSLFPGWRQRGFRRQLARFIAALEEVPQTEAAQLTADDIRTLNGVVDGVVAEAEAFMADRHDATTAEVEQDRFVVTEIYQLRSIIESLSRHFTASPDTMDVGWTIRTETGNRPKE